MSVIAILRRVGLGDKEQMIIFGDNVDAGPSCGTISALQKIRVLWVLSSYYCCSCCC